MEIEVANFTRSLCIKTNRLPVARFAIRGAVSFHENVMKNIAAYFDQQWSTLYEFSNVSETIFASFKNAKGH
jgi:hypothetical protein